MIDIDIQDGDSRVYGTTSDISISRIGDVILFEKNLSYDYQCRSPWEKIFSSNRIELISGTLLGKDLDVIRLYTYSFDINSLVRNFRNKKMNLSILQGGVQYSLCAVEGKFCGSKMTSSEAIFDFEVNKSKMFYDR